MARDPHLRASDADRERVGDLLRQHFAAGRLEPEEFDARLDRCFAAKTYGDLDALLTDLPGQGRYDDLPVPASQTGGAHAALPYARPPDVEVSPWRLALASYLPANLVCWAVWAASGAGGGVPWPVWVSGPWGAVIVGRLLSGADPRSGRPRGSAGAAAARRRRRTGR